MISAHEEFVFRRNDGNREENCKTKTGKMSFSLLIAFLSFLLLFLAEM